MHVSSLYFTANIPLHLILHHEAQLPHGAAMQCTFLFRLLLSRNKGSSYIPVAAFRCHRVQTHPHVAFQDAKVPTPYKLIFQLFVYLVEVFKTQSMSKFKAAYSEHKRVFFKE